MKKALSILISLIYFILTVGISFNIHYCKGEIKSISVIVEDTDCCCEDENNVVCNITDDCCDDEEYLLQFSSNNQLVSINNISFEQNFSILNNKLTHINIFLDDIDLIIPNNLEFLPPKIEHKYIKNCSLIFYA